VLHTVVEHDALNLVAVNVPQVVTINVLPTEVENDALIVLTGLIVGVENTNTTDTAILVSNDYFQMTHAVKKNTIIPKNYW
jgi:hypothetical protein